MDISCWISFRQSILLPTLLINSTMPLIHRRRLHMNSTYMYVRIYTKNLARSLLGRPSYSSSFSHTYIFNIFKCKILENSEWSTEREKEEIPKIYYYSFSTDLQIKIHAENAFYSFSNTWHKSICRICECARERERNIPKFLWKFHGNSLC
jgi:hypothetical protein